MSNTIFSGIGTYAVDGENNPIIHPDTSFSNSPSGANASGGSGPVITNEVLAEMESSSRVVGQQIWNYKVTVNNHIQEKQIPAHAIKLLVIEDDMLSWPLKGVITIDNRMESFERSTLGQENFYHIRADARDEINIEVWPTTKDTLPDDIWKIKLEAIIYDVEDLSHENITTKAKRLYFWDKRFQFLLEKTIEWSTATGERRGWFKAPNMPPVPVAHATDDDRSMYTGDAIASLLIAAGYEDIIDIKTWDRGSSKVCYVAKADCSIYENIAYLLELHVSEDEQDCCGALNWDRKLDKLVLKPFKRDFEKAGKGSPGELQLEHLFYQNSVTDKSMEVSVSPWKAPYSADTSNRKDIKISDFNTILSYRFSQTSGLDSSKAFTTKPVYSHWHKKKQFQCEVQENEIQEVKKFFKEKYVMKLLGKDYPVMTLNKTKKEQYSICPVFSPVSVMNSKEDRYGRSKSGKSATLFAGVMLNQCLSIQLQGSTHRHSGTFVGIDRLYESTDTDYDYQVCGQYYVVRVVHKIFQQKFVNELTLVKVHAYDKLLDKEDVD
jgi:hypothetical protein